jgi:hypothetical protein
MQSLRGWLFILKFLFRKRKIFSRIGRNFLGHNRPFSLTFDFDGFID